MSTSCQKKLQQILHCIRQCLNLKQIKHLLMPMGINTAMFYATPIKVQLTRDAQAQTPQIWLPYWCSNLFILQPQIINE